MPNVKNVIFIYKYLYTLVQPPPLEVKCQEKDHAHFKGSSYILLNYLPKNVCQFYQYDAFFPRQQSSLTLFTKNMGFITSFTFKQISVLNLWLNLSRPTVNQILKTVRDRMINVLDSVYHFYRFSIF